MTRPDFNHLLAFIMVARESSFTRAAAQLGVSQSALSHTIRGLETKLGVRLLTRTTRGVAPTEAGEKLYASLEPHYEGIEAALSALSESRDKPAGTIRITTHDHAASTILWPKLSMKGPDEWFTDTVRIDSLNNAPSPSRVSCASVTFEPDATSTGMAPRRPRR